MLDDVLGYLRCPHCAGSLRRAGGSLRCSAGHSFDIARHGYVSLLSGAAAKNAGDTAAMVRARRDFLAAGHFAPVAAALADTAADCLPGRTASPPDHTASPPDHTTSPPDHSASPPGCVLDVGAGTGYYLAAVLDRLACHVGLALDISKSALRLAARAHRNIGAVGCDAWRPMPIADGAADLILNVLAPRDGAQLRRVLRPDGRLLVVTPAADHLGELIGPLGLLTVDERKRDRLAGKLSPYFDLADQRECRATLSLGHADVRDLAAMGPSSRHIEPAALAVRVARLADPVQVTLAVTLSVLRPARDRPAARRPQGWDRA